MILVPVKNLKSAKQRLASVLDADERQALAEAMLNDVLDALAHWKNHPPVAVVTSDGHVRSLARRHHFEVIEDKDNHGQTEAIALATEACCQAGAKFTLVIPGDVPLVQGWELQKILDAAPPEGCVLVPAHDGRGTNAAWRKPAGLFPLSFGNDSFVPHRAAAEATGKPCVILELAGVGLDVDNPNDLRRLLHSPGETRAQRLCRAWGLETLLAHDAEIGEPEETEDADGEGDQTTSAATDADD